MKVGDIRDELSRDTRQVLEKVINGHQGKEQPYYILIYAEEGLDVVDAETPLVKEAPPAGKLMEVDGKRVIRTKVLVLPDEPPQILGTICYKVDNQKGQLWRLWVLPQDTSRPPEVVDEKGLMREILEATPIIGKHLV